LDAETALKAQEMTGLVEKYVSMIKKAIGSRS
jgi:hypothetical protein